MPLLEHLMELRRRLLWSAAAFIVAFIGCYRYSDIIYGFLAKPLVDILEHQSGTPRRLIFTQLYEVFFTYLKVAFFGGAFIAFPVISTQIWLFVAPGLYRSEKRAFLPFLIATPVLFVAGAALAYYVVFPLAWSFFISFETGATSGVPIQLEAKVSEYLDLVMNLIFACGIAFELPVALTLLAKVGIISSAGLKKYRRYAYVLLCVVAALLAPPDATSMIGFAVLLAALYEISVIAARWVEPKRVVED